MNPHFTPEENAFRLEVRAFMEASVPPSIRRKMLLGQRWSRDDMITWQRILDAKGWGGGWPVEWGGTGWSGVQLYIFREELNRARGIDQLNQNINLAGPVVIAFGTQELTHADSSIAACVTVRRQETQLHRGGVLGLGLLCVDGRIRRGSSSSVHPASTDRRRAIRPDEVEYVISRLQAAHGVWAPLRRSPNKPPALPGVI